MKVERERGGEGERGREAPRMLVLSAPCSVIRTHCNPACKFSVHFTLCIITGKFVSTECIELESRFPIFCD